MSLKRWSHTLAEYRNWNGHQRDSSGFERFAGKRTFIMSQWRRLPFVLMALFALCALTVPSLAWACPITGRSGAATQVCINAPASGQSNQAANVMACCAPTHGNAAMSGNGCLGTCCKAVPQLPNGDPAKNTALSQAHWNIAGLLDQLSQTAHTVFILAPPVAPLVIEPPRALFRGDASVAPLLTQFAFSLFAGRAPPIG